MEITIKKEELQKKSLFIATPMYGGMNHGLYMKACLDLQGLLIAYGVQVKFSFLFNESLITRARNYLVDEFLHRSDCTHFLFIDSDINFEAEDIFRLMAWNSDPKKGIVAGIPVARKKGKTYISTLDADEDENIFMNHMGLVRAKRVATAFMIIRREVFEQLYEAHPEWRYHDEKKVGDEITAFFDFALKDGTYIGEDFLFCDRARELGFEVWIDPTIKLGHMGMEEFAGAFGEDYLYPLMTSIESKKDAA